MQLGQDLAERPRRARCTTGRAGLAIALTAFEVSDSFTQGGNGTEIGVEVWSLEEVIRDFACKFNQEIKLLVEIESSDLVVMTLVVTTGYRLERCEIVNTVLWMVPTCRVVWHPDHPFGRASHALKVSGLCRCHEEKYNKR
jgi:hypothetical protein